MTEKESAYMELYSKLRFDPGVPTSDEDIEVLDKLDDIWYSSTEDERATLERLVG